MRARPKQQHTGHCLSGVLPLFLGWRCGGVPKICMARSQQLSIGHPMFCKQCCLLPDVATHLDIQHRRWPCSNGVGLWGELCQKKPTKQTQPNQLKEALKQLAWRGHKVKGWLRLEEATWDDLLQPLVVPCPAVAFPFFVDLRQPALLLNNTISLYLPTEPGVTVGIW